MRRGCREDLAEDGALAYQHLIRGQVGGVTKATACHWPWAGMEARPWSHGQLDFTRSLWGAGHGAGLGDPSARAPVAERKGPGMGWGWGSLVCAPGGVETFTFAGVVAGGGGVGWMRLGMRRANRQRGQTAKKVVRQTDLFFS